MKSIIVSIQRQKDASSRPYVQKFEYSGDLHIPVTTLLERLNNQEELVDIEGNKASPIHWSCSCQQGLCGSCAMLVNKRPVLGCQVFCHESINQNNEIVIEPLSKFPVILDLVVNRSEMFETMKKMQLWLDSEAKVDRNKVPFEYEVSQCLMCGCCLEACPNYKAGDLFAGMPVAAASVKILEQEDDSNHAGYIKKEYRKRVYKGCVKALACQKVCPMEIPADIVLSKMNRLSVWMIWNLFKK